MRSCLGSGRRPHPVCEVSCASWPVRPRHPYRSRRSPFNRNRAGALAGGPRPTFTDYSIGCAVGSCAGEQFASGLRSLWTSVQPATTLSHMHRRQRIPWNRTHPEPPTDRQRSVRMRTTCLLCGQPLPKATWWQTWVVGASPIDDPNGPQGDACRREFNRIVGSFPPPYHCRARSDRQRSARLRERLDRRAMNSTSAMIAMTTSTVQSQPMPDRYPSGEPGHPKSPGSRWMSNPLPIERLTDGRPDLPRHAGKLQATTSYSAAPRWPA